MPPELLPRDRKALFRERKNERSLSEGGGSNRWRDVKRPGGKFFLVLYLYVYVCMYRCGFWCKDWIFICVLVLI